MKYYRCKCGKKTAWTTMGVQDCEGCRECGTTLAEHPEEHKPVADHAAVVYYRQTDGSPYLVCSKCSSTALGYSPEEEADVIKNLQLMYKVLSGEDKLLVAASVEQAVVVATGEGIDELLTAKIVKWPEKAAAKIVKHPDPDMQERYKQAGVVLDDDGKPIPTQPGLHPPVGAMEGCWCTRCADKRGDEVAVEKPVNHAVTGEGIDELLSALARYIKSTGTTGEPTSGAVLHEVTGEGIDELLSVLRMFFV